MKDRDASMKLIEEILSKTNLNLAYKKVVSNKGAEGIDGVSVSELKEYIKCYIGISIRSKSSFNRTIK